MCMPLDTINTSLVLKVKIPLLPNNLPGASSKIFCKFLITILLSLQCAFTCTVNLEKELVAMYILQSGFYGVIK